MHWYRGQGGESLWGVLGESCWGVGAGFGCCEVPVAVDEDGNGWPLTRDRDVHTVLVRRLEL